MNKAERVKKVRKYYGLSMEKFAEPLGVQKNAISRIENGTRNLTEQMAKAICREYDIDYYWLTEGVGDMFLAFPETVIDEMIIEYGLNPRDKEILTAYVKATDEQRQALHDFLDSLLEQLSK